MKDTECSYCGTVYIEEHAVRKCDDCGAQWCNKCMAELFCPECSKNENQNKEEVEVTEDNLYQHCPQCIKSTYAWKETTTQEVVDALMGLVLETKVETMCITCGHVHKTETKSEVIKDGSNSNYSL